MGKQKLAVFISNMGRGGAEMAAYNLIMQFHETYEIHLVLMQDVIQFELPATTVTHYISRKNYTDFLNILLLPFFALRYRALLRREGIRLSVSFLERPNFIACMAKAFGAGAKTLVTVSTALAAFYRRGTFKGRIGRFLVKWLYSKADHIIPCARYVEHELKTDFGVTKPPYQTIYNGIHLDSVRSQAAEPLPEPKNEFWFAYLGSFYEGKNHKLLVDAFKRFLDGGRNGRLILLGRGYLLEPTRAYVAGLGLEDRVFIPGFTQNPYAYIGAADCFAFASSYEGLPTVLLEALACGKAIVSTDCLSGPREILAPETDFSKQLATGLERAEYGILVPVKDVEAMTEALIRIHDDGALRTHFEQRAPQRAAAFDLAITAASYRTLFQRYA